MPEMNIDSGGTGGPQADEALLTFAPNHHMFSGIVYPDRIANLAAVFDELGLAYSFEVDLPEDVPGPRMYQSDGRPR